MICLDGVSCLDENECKTVDNACPPNSYCINTDGSYLCKCTDGYEMNPDNGQCSGNVKDSSNLFDCLIVEVRYGLCVLCQTFVADVALLANQ